MLGHSLPWATWTFPVNTHLWFLCPARVKNLWQGWDLEVDHRTMSFGFCQFSREKVSRGWEIFLAS